MKTYLPTNVLKAAIHCAAQKDFRYYLNGVCLDFRHTNEPHINIVSTDGAILSTFRVPLEYDDEPQSADYQIIIPIDALKLAVKTKAAQLVLQSTPDGRYQMGDVVFSPVDGKFPDYCRVIPDKTDGTAAQYNPALLARGNAALVDFYSAKKDTVFALHQNGASSAVMCGDDNTAVVVVMPMRRVVGEKYFGFIA